MIKDTFVFKAVVWLYEGPAAWHFITLPKETSKEIDFYHSLSKKGWGSLPVKVSIGKTSWETSIFPDKKLSSYILPLKSEIRKKESIRMNDMVAVTITIAVNR
ncbi:MAG: hypothetical protein QG639_1138 [Patescibacteria group bacterium]|jgi:hypothetical protein|nr:hypothetical protein [Patescibacteria group bacterium]